MIVPVLLQLLQQKAVGDGEWLQLLQQEATGEWELPVRFSAHSDDERQERVWNKDDTWKSNNTSTKRKEQQIKFYN